MTQAAPEATTTPAAPLRVAITRNVVLLGLVSFLTDVSSDMIIPLLPIFLVDVLKTDKGFLGLIEGVAETTASFFKLFSGWLSDRLGKRKAIVLVGYTMSTIGRPLMAVATAGWHVLVVRFFDRIGKGIRGSPRDALIVESCPKHLLGQAFGFHRSMDNLGGVVGALAGSALMWLYPGQFRLVFWCAFIPGVLTIPLLLALREQAPPPQAADAARPPLRLTLQPFGWGFRYYLIVIFLFTLGNSSDAFLLVRAREFGLSDPMVPMFWLALQLVKMVLAFPGGMLADRFGKKRLLILGWLIYAVAYTGFGFATQMWHMWALVGVYGLFYGLTEGGERAIVAELVPAEQKGTAYGLFNFTVGMGLLPASFVTGALYEAAWGGPQLAFGVSAAFALAAAVGLSLLSLQRRAA